MNLLIPEVTIEECAEVIQAIAKYQRFGPECRGYNNKLALAIEIGQLQYMIHVLTELWGLDEYESEMAHAFNEKEVRLEEYAEHSVCNQNQPEPNAKS